MLRERAPFLFILFGGILFVLFMMMILALLPKQTVVFTDEETERETIAEYDPIIGSEDAPILITFYADFLSDSSADVGYALDRITQDYKDDVAIIWKDFPNVSAHPLALSASMAARCAEKQNAFWEYSQMLFAQQDGITSQDAAATVYDAIAVDLDLGMWRFRRCMNKQQPVEDIEQSYQDGLDAEILTAPTLFINDQRLTGSLTESEIRSTILELQTPTSP